MVRFSKWAAWGLLVCCGLAVAAESPRLTAGFLKAEIRPGELVEFEAKLDAASVARFTLKLPEAALLVPITTETGPLRLENGRYLQVKKWVFQAVASGNVRWEALVAQVVEAEIAQVYPLPAATLRIVPYALADASDLPQPLPTPQPLKTPSSGLGFGWGLGGLAALAVCGGFGWFLKRRRARR